MLLDFCNYFLTQSHNLLYEPYLNLIFPVFLLKINFYNHFDILNVVICRIYLSCLEVPVVMIHGCLVPKLRDNNLKYLGLFSCFGDLLTIMIQIRKKVLHIKMMKQGRSVTKSHSLLFIREQCLTFIFALS